MKKLIFCFTAILICIFAINQNSFSTGNIKKVNMSDSVETCLVTGETIEGAGITYKYLNQQVRLCCEGCEKSLKKNPEKYLGAAALWCPVCNEGDAKKTITTTNDGVTYYLCSSGCKKKFNSDADKYLQNYK